MRELRAKSETGLSNSADKEDATGRLEEEKAVRMRKRRDGKSEGGGKGGGDGGNRGGTNGWVDCRRGGAKFDEATGEEEKEATGDEEGERA